MPVLLILAARACLRSSRRSLFLLPPPLPPSLSTTYQALIDNPTNSVPRQSASLKHLILTPYLLAKLPRAAGSAAIKKQFEASDVASKWEQSAWAKKRAAVEKRKASSDFERFEIMILKKSRRDAIRKVHLLSRCPGRSIVESDIAPQTPPSLPGRPQGEEGRYRLSVAGDPSSDGCGRFMVYGCLHAGSSPFSSSRRCRSSEKYHHRQLGQSHCMLLRRLKKSSRLLSTARYSTHAFSCLIARLLLFLALSFFVTPPGQGPGRDHESIRMSMSEANC